MQIDITGYITEARGKDGFKIKVTSDRVDNLFRDIHVSKEVGVFINKYHYPSDCNRLFEKVERGEHNWREIDKCRSLCDSLRVGDQVECAVFIVDTEDGNEADTPAINDMSRNIKDYAEFPLWLYPKPSLFRRSVVDSGESLKFRKKWFYTYINREKCAEITGRTFNDYRNKPWINKNPKVIFPILWWIQVKTAVSNLWERLTGQVKDKPITINTIVTVIAIVIGVIGIIVTIR